MLRKRNRFERIEECNRVEKDYFLKSMALLKSENYLKTK